MSKKKPYQVKDTLAAMQAGEKLVKTIKHHSSSKPVEYHLSPSGAEITPRIAEKVINDRFIVELDPGFFDGASQNFVFGGWQ